MINITLDAIIYKGDPQQVIDWLGDDYRSIRDEIDFKAVSYKSELYGNELTVNLYKLHEGHADATSQLFIRDSSGYISDIRVIDAQIESKEGIHKFTPLEDRLLKILEKGD